MGMAAVADALHHARIEVEGYRKDAERYRWLRSQINTRDKMIGYCIREFYFSSTCDKATLDEAIDACLNALIDTKVAE